MRTLAAVLLATWISLPGNIQASEKLIAVTFDDGPKPYVLYGLDQKTGKPNGEMGLLGVLNDLGIRATFFMMGFKLKAVTGNEENLNAARHIYEAGHEIENHTYGHGPMLKMIDRYGLDWVLKDIEKGSNVIEAITHKRPRFLRPPEWSVNKSLKDVIELLGYTVVTKSTRDIKMPALFADLDTEDWAYYEKNSKNRPLCAQKNPREKYEDCLVSETLKKIEAREAQGVYGHILVFHELPLSRDALRVLITKLKEKGYRFVRLDEYFAKMKGGAR